MFSVSRFSFCPATDKSSRIWKHKHTHTSRHMKNEWTISEELPQNRKNESAQTFQRRTQMVTSRNVVSGQLWSYINLEGKSTNSKPIYDIQYRPHTVHGNLKDYTTFFHLNNVLFNTHSQKNTSLSTCRSSVLTYAKQVIITCHAQSHRCGTKTSNGNTARATHGSELFLFWSAATKPRHCLMWISSVLCL